MVRKSRLKPGDVLSLATTAGHIHLHYLGKHEDYGDAVVISSTQMRDSIVTQDQFKGGYVCFYPAAAALMKGMIKVVGYLPSPGLPQRVRRPGARSERRVETWIIEDETGEAVKRTLTDEERALPIAVV